MYIYNQSRCFGEKKHAMAKLKMLYTEQTRLDGCTKITLCFMMLILIIVIAAELVVKLIKDNEITESPSHQGADAFNGLFNAIMSMDM